MITLQAGDQGGMFIVVAAVMTCISGPCMLQQKSDACVAVATGYKLTHASCNQGYATATWGIITKWEIILVAVVLALSLFTCIVCINGTDILPGSWARNKEIWATIWSHEDPNLRRKLVQEPTGDGFDRKQPAQKPRMYRSAAQQAAIMQL